MMRLPQLFRPVFLTGLGACLELFDFMSFIFLSPILATLFFPQQTEFQGLLYTLIIFSTGYFFRPIGGIILAHFGDRYGRKKIFIICLALMSLPSFVVALLPNPQNLGWIAPTLLALMRMTQGISLGGEVAGSVTYVAEFAPEKWRPLVCSLITSSSNLGVILANIMVAELNLHLSHQALLAWGWRLPFIFGALLGLLALYLRRHISETPVFLECKKQKTLEKLPLLYVLKNHFPALLLGGAIALIVANSTSTFHLYFPTYLSHYLNYETSHVFLISTVGILTLAISAPLFALASPYWGWRKQALGGCLGLFLICGLCVLKGWGLRSVFETYLFVISISLAIAMLNSVLMAVLADLFPAPVRFTGVALAYNMGCLLGAGLTPVLITYVIKTTGYLNTPFALVAACATVAAFALCYSPRSLSSSPPSLALPHKGGWD